MLTQLSIHNVVLIEKLDLKFLNGLTVFTGETGAGKSILLESLGLALGDRSRSGLVRAGATQAMVSATFDLPMDHPVLALLRECGLDVDVSDEALVLRRVVSPDGKSRGFISDRAVSRTLMCQVGKRLIEVQGQHEQMTLAETSIHRDLLDSFGVKSAIIAQVAEAHRALTTAQSALQEAEASMQKIQLEEEWLRLSVDDLSRLAPQEQEEEELVAHRAALQREERQTEAVHAALAELNPRDRRQQGPAAALRAASRILARVISTNDLENGTPSPRLTQGQHILNTLEKAEETVAEVDMLLSRLAQESDVDVAQLETTEERLFALRAAARKHHVSVAELPAFLADLEARLATLTVGQAKLTTLQEAVQAAHSQYDTAAAHLSRARQQAATNLKTVIEKEFPPLKLARARMDVSICPLETQDWGPKGKERVTFLIATNPGQPPGPLGKVASGGELSRIMLALKVVLSEGSNLSTLVFDEVDAGVGGATASAIGERLAGISKKTQVFAVTHSPQIAAQAANHIRIIKTEEHGQTGTRAECLNAKERREELARMLAGEHVTDAARGAADSLLGQTS